MKKWLSRIGVDLGIVVLGFALIYTLGYGACLSIMESHWYQAQIHRAQASAFTQKAVASLPPLILPHSTSALNAATAVDLCPLLRESVPFLTAMADAQERGARISGMESLPSGAKSFGREVDVQDWGLAAALNAIQYAAVQLYPLAAQWMTLQMQAEAQIPPRCHHALALLQAPPATQHAQLTQTHYW